MRRGETRGGFLEEIILEHLKKEEDFAKPCICAVVLCVCTWWVDAAFQGKQPAQMMSPGCGGQREAALDSKSVKDALPQL